MAEKKIWEFIAGELRQEKPVCLVTMVYAKGHTPNRAGAKMVITKDERRFGTVGGGKAEFYLIEKAKKILGPTKRVQSPKVIYMDHRKVDHDAASGLICGGSQTFVLMTLTPDDLEVVSSIIQAFTDNKPIRIQLENRRGLSLSPWLGGRKFMWFKSGGEWLYQETRGFSDIVTLVGGGHVSLALSRVLSMLDMKVVVLDNRPDLDTMVENTWADECRVIDYQKVSDEIPEGMNSYVCIMTFGHQYDEQVLEALIEKEVQYLGMMGSPVKVESIFNNLKSRGITEKQLSCVHAPIGIPIGSNTPEEIAISIAAEIIRERNCFQEY